MCRLSTAPTSQYPQSLAGESNAKSSLTNLIFTFKSTKKKQWYDGLMRIWYWWMTNTFTQYLQCHYRLHQHQCPIMTTYAWRTFYIYAHVFQRIFEKHNMSQCRPWYLAIPGITVDPTKQMFRKHPCISVIRAHKCSRPNVTVVNTIHSG